MFRPSLDVRFFGWLRSFAMSIRVDCNVSSSEAQNLLRYHSERDEMPSHALERGLLKSIKVLRSIQTDDMSAIRGVMGSMAHFCR